MTYRGCNKFAFTYTGGTIYVHRGSTHIPYNGIPYRARGAYRLILPDSLVAIEPHACEGLSNLVGVTLPPRLEYLGESCFAGCFSLKLIVLSNGLLHVPPDAFCDCTSLEQVVFGENVKYIHTRAFAGCSSLKDVDIPQRVTEIGAYAFSRTGLKSVHLHDGIKILGISCFSRCFDLCDVNLGKVTMIEDRAFIRCAALKSVFFPSSLASIGENVFAKSGLKHVSTVRESWMNMCLLTCRDSFSACALESIRVREPPESIKTLNKAVITIILCMKKTPAWHVDIITMVVRMYVSLMRYSIEELSFHRDVKSTPTIEYDYGSYIKHVYI